mgnify:CR=1 FL=1
MDLENSIKNILFEIGILFKSLFVLVIFPFSNENINQLKEIINESKNRNITYKKTKWNQEEYFSDNIDDAKPLQGQSKFEFMKFSYMVHYCIYILFNEYFLTISLCYI